MQFGPGPITPAVRAIIIANVVVFLASLFAGPWIRWTFGLVPADVFTEGRVWQPVTYLFVHAASISHILFNMLVVWMFGVELERRWGTVFFTKYYLVCGVGAGLCSLAASLLPFGASAYAIPTIGASGAVYGLLLAWALIYPDRRVLFMLMFPLPARVFVALIGAIAFFSAIGDSGSPASNVAHLGGLLVGWLYLRGPRDLKLAWQYRLSRWRMERMRRRFNVHQGGRNNRVH